MTRVPRPPSETIIWERDDPGRHAPFAPLRRDEVVRVAVRLADAQGLAAVSVRRIAAELGVGPMRLYRVFDTIDELTELMVDSIYGEIVGQLKLRGAWRSRTRAILSETRAVILRHDWVADLLGARPHLGPHGLAWLESLARALSRAPAVTDIETAWVALGAVSGFLVGSLRREIADRRASLTDGGKPEWRTRMAPYVSRMLDTGAFPTVRGLMMWRNDPDPDAAFQAEVNLILAGLGGR